MATETRRPGTALEHHPPILWRQRGRHLLAVVNAARRWRAALKAGHADPFEVATRQLAEAVDALDRLPNPTGAD
jgi:hypothetical protein